MAHKLKVIVAISSLVGLVVILILVLVLTSKPSSLQFTANCPDSIRMCRGRNELLHVESDKCFRQGESPEGICGHNMAITQHYSCKIQGICECSYRNHDRYLIFHNETNQCYFVYSQGFCDPGEWIELEKTDVVCKNSLCADEVEFNPQEDLNWVPFRNECHRLFSQDIPGCQGDLRFHKGFPKPTCNQPPSIPVAGVGAIPAANFKCPPGSFQAVNGFCQPTIIIDFDD